MKPIVSGEVIHDDFAANLALHEDASSDRLVELLSLVQSFDEGLVGIGVNICFHFLALLLQRANC